jgi:hypothetical protein
MGGGSRSRGGSRWLLLLDVLYLTALLAFVGFYLRTALSRSWFFSSEEYVFGAEVIRFLQLDFRQRFFDMPGTPLMILTALVWAVYYWAQVLAGTAGGATRLALYTFEHIDALFVLMRVLTLLFFGLSVVLLYALAARLTNRMGAWFATLLLAASPAYTSYSSFVRIESLSLSFMLASLVTATYWAPRPQPRLLWTAGILAGLGTACRFHAATAILPVLFLFLLGRPRMEPAPDYPASTKTFFAVAGAMVVGLGGVLLAGRHSLFAPIPNAWALLFAFSAASALGLVLVWLAYRRDTTRPLLLRLLPSETATLACAFGIGVLAGTPTVLWQPYRMLQSMESYRRAYVDLDRAAWPLWQNVTWYVNFYVNQAAPLRMLLILMLAGIALAIVRRDWKILWIAAGAILFFVSKPLNLTAAAHHIIMWLPYFAIVAAYPIAAVWQLVQQQPIYARVAVTPLFVGSLAYLWVSLAPGVRAVAANQSLSEQRMTSIRQATAWIKGNTEKDATVLVAYFCFNEDIVYSMFKFMAVPVPAPVWDGRTWVIWWGNARTFKGQSGYALSTSSDVHHMKKLDLHEPGQGTDPYTDKRFRLIRSFGKEPTRVDVFRFDDAGGVATVRGKK